MNPLITLLIVGILFWGGWPLVAAKSNIQDPFVRAFLVNVVAVIGLLPFVYNKISGELLASRAGLFLLLAGLLNWGGHALFPRIQTSAGSQASVYMAIIPGLVVVANVLGGAAFLGEPLTSAKIFFSLVIIVGIVGMAFASK